MLIMYICDEKEFKKEFGERLRKLIEKSGMDQLTVSEQSEVSHNVLQKYIRGANLPSARSIINLKYALDCDYEDLIGFCDFVE